METLTSPRIQVGMGQLTLQRGPYLMTSILGSCIGLALYNRHLRLGMLAHVVLPSSTGRTGAPGKFADTALAEMLLQLKREGIDRTQLVAKLAGGANMFSKVQGPLQIGEQNLAACRQRLTEEKIHVVGEHIGGSQGRRITFHADSGIMEIEIAGQVAVTI